MFYTDYLDAEYRIFIYSLKKRPLYSLNNSVKNELSFIIFGIQNPQEMSHQKIINSPSSPHYLVKNNSSDAACR